MKNVASSIIAVTALTFSSAVYAQSFTFDVVWKPVERVGGMTGSDGNLYGGGAVSGTYTTTYADGTKTNGTARCVGMSQPQGSIFAIHLACTTTEGKDTATEVYGCNYLGKPGPETALGCVSAASKARPAPTWDAVARSRWNGIPKPAPAGPVSGIAPSNRKAGRPDADVQPFRVTWAEA